MEVFAEWAKAVLFATEDEDSIPILIFPQSSGRPSYRDTIPE